MLWATGFRPDHSWLDIPVRDRTGRIRHDGGVVTGAPGLYLLGMPVLRTRASTYIHGAATDSEALAATCTPSSAASPDDTRRHAGLLTRARRSRRGRPDHHPDSKLIPAPAAGFRKEEARNRRSPDGSGGSAPG